MIRWVAFSSRSIFSLGLRVLFDLGQDPFWSPVNGDGMKQPEEPRPGEDEPPPKRSRLEEARRIVEEYAADLRKIIEKLRRKLN